MGRFDKAANAAAKATDAELKGDLKKLLAVDGKRLLRLFPKSADKKKMRRLINKIRRATKRNQIVAAGKEFMASASKGAIKAARKIVTSGLAVLALVLPSMASIHPSFYDLPLISVIPINSETSFIVEKVDMQVLPSNVAVSGGVARGPLDVIGRFVASQEAIVGISFSPLDVKNPDLAGITLIRGPAYGEHGLSLLPEKNRPGAKAYIELDYGGRFTKNEIAFRAMVGLHPANITNLILRRVIKTDRIRVPPLPENFIGGPMVRVPLPGEDMGWTWKNGFRFVLAYRFE